MAKCPIEWSPSVTRPASQEVSGLCTFVTACIGALLSGGDELNADTFIRAVDTYFIILTYEDQDSTLRWGEPAGALLIINFNGPDIAQEVRRPDDTQLIKIQWINADCRLNEIYRDAVKIALTEAKK